MNLAKYSLDNTKIIYFFLAVLLIGAGVTGAAIARELMRWNVDLLWVEN